MVLIAEMIATRAAFLTAPISPEAGKKKHPLIRVPGEPSSQG
jgi:hypothetical protein